jgi:hypothetical protein
MLCLWGVLPAGQVRMAGPTDRVRSSRYGLGLSNHVAVGAYSARMTDIVTSQRLPLILTR